MWPTNQQTDSLSALLPPAMAVAYWDLDGRLVSANTALLETYPVNIGATSSALFQGPEHDLPFVQALLDESKNSVDKCVQNLISFRDLSSLVIESSLVAFLMTKTRTLHLAELTVGMEASLSFDASSHPASRERVRWRIVSATSTNLGYNQFVNSFPPCKQEPLLASNLRSTAQRQQSTRTDIYRLPPPNCTTTTPVSFIHYSSSRGSL